MHRALVVPVCIAFLAGATAAAPFLLRPTRGSVPPAPIPVAVDSTLASAVAARPARGWIIPVAPVGTNPRQLRVTLLRYGDVVRAASGRALAGVPYRWLLHKPLEPGFYVARFYYRGVRLPDETAEVTEGESAQLQPNTERLAEIEYRAGLDHAGRGGTDIPYFRRVLVLNPKHVGAHLQLAAYELATGNLAEARSHVAAVRQVEARNADADRVEAVLRKRGHLG